MKFKMFMYLLRDYLIAHPLRITWFDVLMLLGIYDNRYYNFIEDALGLEFQCMKIINYII